MYRQKSELEVRLNNCAATLRFSKNKSLTPEERKALEGLLHAVHPYCSELDVTLLFPQHRLPLLLDGNTPEERMEELIHKCSEVFEAVMTSDNQPIPTIDFIFVRWFSRVFSTEFPIHLVYKVLEKGVKKERK